MFHLILTACLAGNSGICGPVLLPQGDAATQQDCEGAAARISHGWLADHAGLTSAAVECRPSDQVEALELQEIAPGIWLRQGATAQLDAEHRGRIANLSVIIGTDSVAVIDSGSSRAEGQAFYAAIRRLTDKPISHLILTHMHPDHTLGASVFAEAGATLVASQQMPPALEARAQTYLDNLTRILGPAEMIGTTVSLPQLTVAEESSIDLGDRSLRLRSIETAHTDNDLTVRDDATGTVFTGDLVFRGLTPVIDGSINGWLHWLNQPSEKAMLIVPGHGEIAKTWEEAVAKQRDILIRLRDSVRRAISEGESMTEAVPKIVADLMVVEVGWTAFAETIARDATAAYKELEWE